MSGFQCPYCNMIMPVSDDTISHIFPAFKTNRGVYQAPQGTVYSESCIHLTFYNCPNCDEYTIFAEGLGEKVSDVQMQIRPKSLAQHFPNYVPAAIRNDYKEACAIVNLSPKASATLSRRCLQGMIRDFWNVSKPNLYQEIDAIKDKLPAAQWSVLDGIRRIGNIGAHMEKDIDLIIDIEPAEAQKLIKLIELLIKQWYIERHDQEQLFADIIGIDQAKQEQRKQTE